MSRATVDSKQFKIKLITDLLLLCRVLSSPLDLLSKIFLRGFCDRSYVNLPDQVGTLGIVTSQTSFKHFKQTNIHLTNFVHLGADQ